MRSNRPLGATYLGLVILGVSGWIGLGVLCVVLFLFREQCEPVLRFALPLLGGRRGHLHYNPDDYYFFATIPGMMAGLWAGLTVRAIVRKPAEDRAIDKRLRSKLIQTSRGAPLEPK